MMTNASSATKRLPRIVRTIAVRFTAGVAMVALFVRTARAAAVAVAVAAAVADAVSQIAETKPSVDAPGTAAGATAGGGVTATFTEQCAQPMPDLENK